MSSKFSGEFDLLGWPVATNYGGKGKPPHVPSPENVNVIKVMMAEGATQKEIREVLGISAPTFREHYSSHWGERALANKRLRIARKLMLYEIASTGSVPALKELDRLDERDERSRLAAAFNGSPKPSQQGKKERRKMAAKDAISGGGWADLLPEGTKPQ